MKKTTGKTRKIRSRERMTNSRRRFIKLLGIGLGTAIIPQGCEKPVIKAIPYLNKPEEIIPGKATYYASSYFEDGLYSGIVAKVREGRPVKIEGNELSSYSAGKSTARIQASLLDLYDDFRQKAPLKNKETRTWDAMDIEIRKKLEELRDAGRTIYFLTSTLISPSSERVIRHFSEVFPTFSVIYYDAISASGMLDAYEEIFGKRLIPDFRFDQSSVVVSFGADFLGTWLSPLEYARQYAAGRDLINRAGQSLMHIQFESGMSLTGMNADRRYPIMPSEQKNRLYSLLQTLKGEDCKDSDILNTARLLIQHKRKSLVLSGSNDREIQLLVIAINHELENYGNTILFNRQLMVKQGNDKKFREMLESVEVNQPGALLIHGLNPVYECGEDFLAFMHKIPVTISFSSIPDETSEQCTYVCPDNHFLESWDDAQPKSGIYSLCQPVISPLFNTRQWQDSMLVWSGHAKTYQQIIRDFWLQSLYPVSGSVSDEDTFWIQTLQQGVLEVNMPEANSLEGNKPFLLLNYQAEEVHALELEITENAAMGTGKNANNPLLQEMPDPVTKANWGNYASISQMLAMKYALHDGDIIKLNDLIDVPVIIQPGQADNCISLAFGYGRTVSGVNGLNRGCNASVFINIKEKNRLYHTPVSITKTGQKLKIPRTQQHDSSEGRAICQQVTLSELARDEEDTVNSKGQEESETVSLYEKHEYKGHHWALAVDLNLCIGCQACVIACNVENNIPVVGMNEITKFRDMHWIRIDRYYSGDRNNPEVSLIPVMCQHCDQAPCENVCPVGATMHSSEGINQMIYNRCIGTRYCNNNCPYKVRRFNYYDYNKADAISSNTYDPTGMTTDLRRMALNPDVTVRAKGVIEKCSFCFQRVQDKKNQARIDGRALMDGEIKTACEQVCPTNALVFGDINDPQSRISKLFNSKRKYHLLEEINTLPSVAYLKKIHRV